MPNNPITFDQTPPSQTEIEAAIEQINSVAGEGSAQGEFTADADGLWGYGITACYARDRGLRGAPVAGPYGTRQAVWRCHGGSSRKLVFFVASRFQLPPVLPHPDTGSDNDVLLYDYLTPTMKTAFVGGGVLYTVVGSYEYLMQQPPGDGDPILFPESPLLAPSAVTLNPSAFSRYLIPGLNPGSFTGSRISY